MSKINHPYFRFMSEIVELGIWSEMSNAARALYPVLLKFSDFNFKPVWPGTDELLRLTGFKTKKSLRLARQELKEKGLITFQPGSGRRSTVYYFHFPFMETPGYAHIPQRDARGTPTVGQPYPSGGAGASGVGDTTGPPNNIQITIHNNQNNKHATAGSRKSNKQTRKLASKIDRRNHKKNELINSHHSSEVSDNDARQDEATIKQPLEGGGAGLERPKEATGPGRDHWNQYPGTGVLEQPRTMAMGLQSKLNRQWAGLSKLLIDTCTAKTQAEFNKLRPAEADGQTIIFGPKVSSHLQTLIRAKLPQAVFSLDDD